MQVDHKSQFHITIGASIDHNSSSKSWQTQLDVSPDLRLLKAALLYADKVQFFSYGASGFLNLMDRPKGLSENEKLDWILAFYHELGHPPHIEQVTNFVQEYRASRKNRKKDFQNYLSYKYGLDKSFRDMDQATNDAGIRGLNNALASGLVEFKPFNREGNTVEDYFEAVSKALTSGDTYPLLDSPTGKLVELAIKEGKISLLGTSEKRAKHVGTSSGLIERLPLFDFATVDEVLDIRRELEEPLIRFRAAIMAYSSEIKSVPWDSSFSQEIEERLFYKLKFLP
ncbi:MAG TPA: hypothetical protein P5280_10170, partial [Cyclobacteriaceae bacterium]|nr:hypothetical protein [Cyclobacteriaceae bacterium]